LTTSKEDYLKIIYDAGGMDTMVSNKVIAEKLGVAPASVSGMLIKLDKQGLIHYQPYKGSQLSEEGLKVCLDVVRSHRLWEVFLLRYLEYSWREAHEDAHILEHANASRLIDRLEKFLDYPETCPHGSMIPHKGQKLDEEQLIFMSSLEPGEKAVIIKVNENSDFLDYLERTGLKIGAHIEIADIEQFEGSITFRQGVSDVVTVGHKAATMISVQREV